MNEQIIEIYDDKGIVITLIKKDSRYIVEKCIANKSTISLYYHHEFYNLDDARNKYNELKAQ